MNYLRSLATVALGLAALSYYTLVILPARAIRLMTRPQTPRWPAPRA